MEDEKDLLEFFKSVIPDDVEKRIIELIVKDGNDEDILRSLIADKDQLLSKRAQTEGAK